MRLSIFNRQRQVKLDLPWLRKLAPVAVKEIFAASPHPASTLHSLEEVEVAIVSDRAIGKVHAEFFSDPSPTDVITFEHGEILISAQTAKRVSAELQIPPEHEVALYMIHGLLHLDSYTDLHPAGRKAMHREQDRILKRVLGLLLIVLMAVPAFAQDSGVVDTQAMLKALNEIKQKQQAAVSANRQKTESTLMTAAASPSAAMDLYEQCVMATQFEGKNREHGEFRDWKNKEQAKLSDPDLKTSLQYHLRYLALTMERSANPDAEAVYETLGRYLDELVTLEPAVLQKDFLSKPLGASPFVKWLDLQRYITVKEWEMVPGNAQGIAEKTLLPRWRQKKDPRLLAYWDRQITLEANDKEAKETGAFDSARFNEIRKPTLLWNRSQDLLLLGQKNRAMTDMFALIKAYPTHPDAEKWIDSLEALAGGGGAVPAK